jgi:hypothetical protein
MDFARRTLIALVCSASVVCAAASLEQKADEAAARKEMFVAGDDGWRFLPAELRFASKLASPDLASLTAPAIGTIADFAAQMRKADIQLVVLPVPPKVLLAGAALGVSAEELEKMRAGWESIMGELADHDVTVVDLLPDYAAAKHEPFCRRDTHWSGRGIATAVERLLPLLRSAGVTANKSSGRSAWTRQRIQGDLGGDPEEVELRVLRGTSRSAVAGQGPLLVLGDSHALVFHEGGDMHATGAGLPDQIASATGTMPDVLGVRGSGATSSRLQLARRARANPSYLSSKKAVIWCFAGREFTEAEAWKKLPILKAAGS